MPACGVTSYATTERDWFHRVLELLRPRVKKLGQFVDDGRPFFADAIEYDAAAVQKHLRVTGMRDHLLELSRRSVELSHSIPRPPN